MRRRANRKTRELYYIELRTAGRIPLLKKPVFRDKIISSLKWSCENRGLRIYDYTILPDRITMIANTAWGSLPDVLASFRDYTSKGVMLILRNGRTTLEGSNIIQMLQEHQSTEGAAGLQIWENEAIIKSIYTQDQIDKCAENIHQKALKMGLAANPEEYQYCSANPKHPLDGWVVEATDPWS